MKTSDVTDAEICELIEDLQQHQFELTQQNEELRRTQEQLALATEKFRDLWHQAPIGYILHNRAGLISDANNRVRQLLETDGRHLKGTMFQDFLDPESRLVFCQHLLSTRDTEKSTAVEVRVDENRHRELWLRADSIVTGRGEYRTALIDVTAERKAEQERLALASHLQHIQKMDVLHELSAGIAHDFNNVLQIITAHGEFIADQVRMLGGDTQSAETLLQGTQRGADLTRRLLAFSRRSPMQTQDVDLRTVVEGATTVIRRTLGEHIQLTHTSAAQALPAAVDRGLIEQAILNLCLNARGAMPDGGRLLVDVAHQTLRSPRNVAGTTIKPGAWGVLTVADEGVGMPAEVLEKIFEPFYTTKRSGSGTGLGLSIVYGIVRQHGGGIEVQSTPNRGTIVTIYLPLADVNLTLCNHGDRTYERPHMARRSGHILLVEDEAAIRGVLRKVLIDAGYTVDTAENGQQAIGKLRQQKSVDLLLTDVVMPNGSGKDVCEVYHQQTPGRPVVFLTGHGDGVIDHEFLKQHDALLLNKPVSPGELIDMVGSRLIRVS